LNRLEVDGEDLTIRFRPDLDELDSCDIYLQLSEEGPRILCDWAAKHHQLDHRFTIHRGGESRVEITMIKIGHAKELPSLKATT